VSDIHVREPLVEPQQLLVDGLQGRTDGEHLGVTIGGSRVVRVLKHRGNEPSLDLAQPYASRLRSR
jgi:hypothetical protein